MHLRFVYGMGGLKITMTYSNISRVIVYPILFISKIERYINFSN